MTHAEMDEQDKDYQVKRIDALEALVKQMQERDRLQSKAMLVLRGELRTLKADVLSKSAEWVAAAAQEMEDRLTRVEERAGYLMYHAN